MLAIVSRVSATLLDSDRMVAPMATGASSSSEIEQHRELQDVEGQEDGRLAVVDARRARPADADGEVEQGRERDRAADRQDRHAEAQPPVHDGGGEGLARDRAPADRNQRAQAHATAQHGHSAGAPGSG